MLVVYVSFKIFVRPPTHCTAQFFFLFLIEIPGYLALTNIWLNAGNGTGGSAGYSQAWLRGEGPGAHVHEGIQFADKSGWVGIGELLPEEGQTAQNFKVL